MKSSLIILFGLSGSVFAQTTAVTKNPNNNQITASLVMGPNRLLTFEPGSFLLLNGTTRTSGGLGDNGKVQVNNNGIVFNSVDGMLTVTGNNNHAIIGRTLNPNDGIAVVGWSSSGAAALKAVQDTHFTSPALTAWRDLSLGTSEFTTTPGLLVAVSGGLANDEPAVEVKTNNVPKFKITWKGFVTSAGKPVMRFHGRLTSAPSGVYGTDYAAGDLYYNTTDSKFYCHDGDSWRAM